jgi:hypothetical protein
MLDNKALLPIPSRDLFTKIVINESKAIYIVKIQKLKWRTIA